MKYIEGAPHVDSFMHDLAVMVYLNYVKDLLRTRFRTFVEAEPVLRETLSKKVAKLEKDALTKAKRLESRTLGSTRYLVQRRVLHMVRERCKEIGDIYRRNEEAPAKTKAMLYILHEELMRVTWHPNRMQWWISEDEKKEIFGNPLNM
jgi:hypothetical protein